MTDTKKRNKLLNRTFGQAGLFLLCLLLFSCSHKIKSINYDTNLSTSKEFPNAYGNGYINKNNLVFVDKRNVKLIYSKIEEDSIKLQKSTPLIKNGCENVRIVLSENKLPEYVYRSNFNKKREELYKIMPDSLLR